MRTRSTARAYRRRRAPGDRPKHDGSRQSRHEEPYRGRAGHVAGPDAYLRQLPRQPYGGSPLDAVLGVRTGRYGRPGRRPGKLQANSGYDHRRCRRECRARSITPRNAWRSIDNSEPLGRYRWIVEQMLTWLARFRRPAIRYAPTSTSRSRRSAGTRSGQGAWHRQVYVKSRQSRLWRSLLVARRTLLNEMRAIENVAPAILREGGIELGTPARAAFAGRARELRCGGRPEAGDRPANDVMGRYFVPSGKAPVPTAA